MRVVLPVCLAMSAAVLLAAPVMGQELTEEQALARFVAQSPEVRVLRQQVLEQAQRNRARTLMANPMLWYTQENAADARDDFLMVRQPLPITGRLGLYDTANREAMAATEASVEYRLYRLSTEVRGTFASLLRAQRRHEALARALEDIDETIRVLRAREREGEGSRFDRLRGEREGEELRATLASEAIARARAQSRLAGLIGMRGSAEALVALPPRDERRPLPAVEEAVDRALASRGDLRAGSARLASTDAEAEAARRLRFPEPAVVGGIKRTTLRGVSDLGYAFGVELTLPIPNRGQVEGAQLAAVSDRLTADQEALRLRIEREVRAAHRAVTLTRQQARAYVDGAASSGVELARIARLAYEEGEEGILELLDAHRVALAASLRAIDLMDAAHQAEIDLSRVIGSEVWP